MLNVRIHVSYQECFEWLAAIQQPIRIHIGLCVLIDMGEMHEIKGAYRLISNTSRTLVGNKIVDHSDVIGASPVGAAPTTSSFSTQHLASMDWAKTTARRNRNV